MRYSKLNKNWNADPNAPEPVITRTDDGIALEFGLNAFVFDYIEEGDSGRLVFVNVNRFSLGPTNDEGYFRGQFRYNNDQLPWGEFYELFESNWQDNFPNDKELILPISDLEEPRHFIFFFRSNTFECVADDFYFNYLNKRLQNLTEKYPNGYFDHFLAMFASTPNETTIDDYRAHCEQYISIEGDDAFKSLKKEIEEIRDNNDIGLFIKLANTYELEKFGPGQMHEMMQIIEAY